jgi:hypothetical protein
MSWPMTFVLVRSSLLRLPAGATKTEDGVPPAAIESAATSA